MATDIATAVCFYCGDSTPDHKHYTVKVYKDGKFTGRLDPDGFAVTRKLFAAVMGHEAAVKAAGEINAHTAFTAKVDRF